MANTQSTKDFQFVGSRKRGIAEHCKRGGFGLPAGGLGHTVANAHCGVKGAGCGVRALAVAVFAIGPGQPFDRRTRSRHVANFLGGLFERAAVGVVDAVLVTRQACSLVVGIEFVEIAVGEKRAGVVHLVFRQAGHCDHAGNILDAFRNM